MSLNPLNSFPVALSGVTLLGVAGLFYYGQQGGSRYEAAKSEFEQTVTEVASIEKTVPYPNDTNRNAKKKAIEDFKKDVESLQNAFSAYRPAELKMVSPEHFIDRLRAVNEETREEFKSNAVMVPELYFAGFKDYTGKFPNKSATGILGYQLEAIREMQLALAHSGASELRNLHRPALDEENGLVFQAPDGMEARPLPLEITFRGPERAVRTFLSALAGSEKHYWVIRSLRVSNLKKDPPKTSDAKFNIPAARNPATPAAIEDIFRFEEQPAEGGAAAPAPGAAGQPAPVPAPAPGATGQPAAPPAPVPAVPAPAPEGNRILALILGNEELLVHVRLDLMLFLKPKQLP